MWRQKRHTHYRMIPERLNFRYTAIKKQCPILLTFQVAFLLINNNVKATTGTYSKIYDLPLCIKTILYHRFKNLYQNKNKIKNCSLSYQKEFGWHSQN